VPAPRLLIGLGVLVAAVVLFVVLRPGGDGEPAADAPADAPTVVPAEAAETETQPEPTVPAEDEETVPEEQPEAPAEPQVPTLAILIRGGVPEGGIQRLTVDRGDEVRVVVRADTADEIHLHGYDLFRRVGPGAPAQFRFRATTPGRFELETHERHVLVGELEVRP
jgi:hypothetical protein